MVAYPLGYGNNERLKSPPGGGRNAGLIMQIYSEALTASVPQ